MSDPRLDRFRELIQVDVNNRGLAAQPERNLLTVCPGDLAAACQSIASHPAPRVAVVTGFFIPHGKPPAAETDGPLGAVFLARALVPLGVKVALLAENWCQQALQVGLAACGLAEQVTLLEIDRPITADAQPGRTHLIALERVGPSHTLQSLEAQLGPEAALSQTYLDFSETVPPEHRDRPHNMRGRDISEYTAPAHRLFEFFQGDSSPHPQLLSRRERGDQERVVTIGIGDGGNEIGMGKIPWEVIRKNIPNGGRIACRIATQHLIVCGVSNWGAYALGHGVRLLRGAPHEPRLYDPEVERELLRIMVEQGPLIDGVTGQQTVTVDGLPFERYVEPLVEMGKVV